MNKILIFSFLAFSLISCRKEAPSEVPLALPVTAPIVGMPLAPSTPISPQVIPMPGTGNMALSGNITINKDQEAYQKANESLDPDICSQITSETMRTMCTSSIISQKAKRDKDEKLCEKLVDPMTRTMCTDSTIREKIGSILLTKTSLDPSICQKLSNEMDKAACINTIATNLAQANGSSAYCANLDPMSRSDCVLKAAIQENTKSGNTKACDALIDPMSKQSCVGLSLIARVVKTKDFKHCSEVMEIQSNCERESAKKLLESDKNPLYCTYLGVDKNKCLVAITARQAISAQQKDLCNTLKDSQNQASCRARVDTFEQSIQ